MGDKKEKKKVSKKDKAEDSDKIDKKAKSDEILESLFNDVKNSEKPIDLSVIINQEKTDKSKHKHKSKKKKEKKSKKARHSSASVSPLRSDGTIKSSKHKKSGKSHSSQEKSSKRRSSERSLSPTEKPLKRRHNDRSLSPLSSFRNEHKKRDRSSSHTPKRAKKARTRSYSRETDIAFDRSIEKERKYQSRDYSLDKRTTSRRRYDKYDRSRSRSRDRRRVYTGGSVFGKNRRERRIHNGYGSVFRKQDYTNEHGEIDKEKLLAIATKNATRLAMEGKLPKGTELLDTIKNKSIDQLVDICKKIKDDEIVIERVSSDDEETYNQRFDKWTRDKRDREDDSFVPRPIRSASEIKINISNANSLPTKTPKERVEEEGTLRLSFPVSSGAHHRDTSDWQPVIKPIAEPLGPLTTALSRIKTNIPAAYKAIAPATEIYPTAQPVSSLGAQFSATTTASIGPSQMPPPPLPPILTTLTPPTSTTSIAANSISNSKVENFGEMKETVEKKEIPMTLPPPPQPPSFGSFDRLPTKLSLAEIETAKKRAIEVKNEKKSENKEIEEAKKRLSVILNESKYPAPESLAPPPPPPQEPPSLSKASSSLVPYNQLFNGNTRTSFNSVYSSFTAATTSSSSITTFRDGSTKGVFPDSLGLTKPKKSVTELVSERLKYSNRLKEDPNDYEARKKIAKIDDEMNEWAQSRHLPGKFIGSTGARILTAEELAPSHPRYNAWAKKDLFQKAPEVNGGVGMKLLQKMGWQPGEGLGKDGMGCLTPLALDVKADRRGLSSHEDKKVSRREAVVSQDGKNPVSVLMEYCSKTHLPHPEFETREIGPCSNKRFLCKALLNGVEYEPSLPSSNKKAAKSQVCMVILEALGLSG